MDCNGMELQWNGTKRNGMDGMEWNGLDWTGLDWTGLKRDRMENSGIQRPLRQEHDTRKECIGTSKRGNNHAYGYRVSNAARTRAQRHARTSLSIEFRILLVMTKSLRVTPAAAPVVCSHAETAALSASSLP